MKARNKPARSSPSRPPNQGQKRGNFVSPTEKAKSELVKQLVRMARKARLDYDDFQYVTSQARKKLELHQPKQEHKLPHLLSETDLKRFFQTIQKTGDVQHEIMLKLLFFTGVRVSELVAIQKDDVDIQASKIFIRQGKGSKDRHILFPESFRLVLKSHLKANPHNRYLFETRRFGPFTTRRVQQIVQHYREQAGLTTNVHPHLFRHQMLTYLTSQGLTDSQLQLISGHGSKQSLEIYQHLSLENVKVAYQQAMRLLTV
jgi:site-specific recombinase XerD